MAEQMMCDGFPVIFLYVEDIQYRVLQDDYNFKIKLSNDRTLYITKRDLTAIIKSGNKQRKSWMTPKEFLVLAAMYKHLKV